MFLNSERREAGKPVAHECVQDEGTGLRRPTEDGGEGAERRPAACSSLPLQGQDCGQGDTGHPRTRGCEGTYVFSCWP